MQTINKKSATSVWKELKTQSETPAILQEATKKEAFRLSPLETKTGRNQWKTDERHLSAEALHIKQALGNIQF